MLQESLSELRDIITTRGLKLHFRAQLHLGISVTGEARETRRISPSAGSAADEWRVRVDERGAGET